ncbi:ExbD/TolR family protein [Ferrimonas senticii]|uniref:ExbD/TolR family protein n=1 Tax=Ferrimonas senticii TaxID=394566 RepID=UPI00040F903F|nr:biopolymer transporter ExbD [Ferrimonas senticii]
MKQSAKARRLAKHHRRLKASSKLNLVSLMDIFTILVFFLIVNQSEVRVLQNVDKMQLPVSVADTLPSENLVITVLAERVLVQDRSVWQPDSSGGKTAAESFPALRDALRQELEYHAQKRPQLTEQEQVQGRAVTIIGDAGTSYQLLKPIMAACASSGFRNISLAVEQQPKEAGA